MALMNRDNRRMREIAQRLLTHEAAQPSHTDAAIHAAMLVSEKLRRPISTLAGATGFRSLLARALSLAKAEAPGLSGIAVNPDGSLADFNNLPNGQADADGVLLISQLLGLIDNFIGEPLTLRLLHDAWPDLPDIDSKSLGEQK
jgi:hypothetical protein